MSEVLSSEFGPYKIEIKSMRLRSANEVFPIVMREIPKLVVGRLDLFSELKTSDLQLLQEKICENTLKIVERKQEDGSIVNKKENLSLSDIDENISDFVTLMFVFMEHQFGFFSKAQKVLEAILRKDSKTKETD